MRWTISKSSIQETVLDKTDESDIPADIMSLVGVASSISEEDIKNDDRLAYLLRKWKLNFKIDSNKKAYRKNTKQYAFFLM